MGNYTRFYPLTHPQKVIWYTEKLHPDTSIGNIAATLRFKGNINYPLLEKAINTTIKVNDSMRIRLVEQDGEPRQYISDFEYKKLDFFDFSNTENGLEDLYKWDEKFTHEPFELIDSDLFYFALVKVIDEDGGIYFKTHHIISDAWTMSLIGNQIVEFYTRLKEGLDICTDKKPSYIEFVLSEEEYKRSNRFQRDKEYWNNLFKSYTEKTILKTRSSNEIITKARRKTLVAPKKLTAKIHEYCLQNKTSVFALFLAALSMYINRTAGKEDIVLGTTTLNRSNAREKETVGMFSNIVPIRININDNIDFKTFSETIAKESLTLLRHQKYPYDLLLKDIRGIHKEADNLYEIVLNYQNTKFNKAEHKEEYITRWHFNGHQTEALSININDRESEGHLIIDYDYLSDLFNAKEIEFIHQHIINLLWHGLDNPSKKISNLEMLSEKEKYKILYEFNDTKAEYTKDKTLQQVFEDQVKKTPDNIAVVFEDKQLNYEELNEKSNQLAKILRQKGVKADSIVGIMIYRSLEMIIGIMGILKAGGAYLPINPDYPEDRIKYMLEDSSTHILLSQQLLKEKVKFDGEIIDLEDKELYTGDKSNLESINKPNDLAYVIYTSGSTGKPKGVMIEHYSVINRINWMQKKYPISETSCILQKTPYTFDVSVWELLWWSFVGAKVCMLEPDGEKDPETIINAIEKNKVTTMHFVPSMLSIFLHYIEEQTDLERLSSLKQVFASGEALNIQQVEKFNKLLNQTNNTELYNLYGPTEATVDVSYFDCSTGEKLNVVPIGKPIDNIKLYILDKNYNLQPIGVPGELCIGGDGVARGYMNKPELTKEKFVPNPFIEGERIYKTGDLARWFPRGDIEYLGRMDFQVKIRGNRIELGEIENRLRELEYIKDAVVIAKEDKGGSKYLCAYIVCNKEIAVSDLKEHLLRELPDYMVPAYFIRLDKLPLSPNGKVDRKGLPEPKEYMSIETEYTPPSNEIEEKLVEIWRNVLEVEKIGVNDNFFSLGGDSLTVIETLTRAYKHNWGLTIKDFYNYQTIKELSDKIRGIKIKESGANLIDIINMEVKEEVVQISGELVRPENVLLTGATGFLGIHILSELLNTTEANIFCLVRGKSKTHAEKRMKETLDFYFKDKYSNLIGKRILVVNGDITFDRLGLSETEYNQLVENIDTVVHAAAIVKYYGDYKNFDRVNVSGTKRIIDFAQTNNKRLIHISTVAVSGNYLITHNGENRNFSENDFYVGQNYFENVYVRSKFEAENLVFKAMKEGLDVTIFRMGNLTGRYSDGHFQSNIIENDFYSIVKSIIKLGVIPREFLEQEVEFTPVDYVSRAIVLVSKTKEAGGRVFHMFNHKIIKMKDIVDIFKVLGIEIKVFDNAKFKKYVEEVSTDVERQSILTGIIDELSGKRELDFKASIYVDSNITHKYLIQLGFDWPVIDREYIKRITSYMRYVGFLV